MRERHAVHNPCNSVCLGHILLQKLHASGRVIEQIAHDQRRPLRAARIIEQRLLSALNAKPRAHRLLLRPGQELHARNRCYGGQRLAAETQGADAV